MEPKGINFLIFANTSPIFKGITVTISGLVVLGFAYWLYRRWKEPLTWQFKVFIGIAIFYTLYGLFILIFRPQWWIPPWWPQVK